jgi:beta-glucosidase
MGIGLAASWDIDLAERIGASIGKDARARGIHFMLGPGVNIYPASLNGRNFEYFGEDPFLTSSIAVRYIKGMQSQGVSATVKHFLANNSE